MATYKESIGTAVQNVAGDPPAPLIGQVWYNSSTFSFRVRRSFTGLSWSTGNDMNSTRNAMGSAGTQTAALAFGGMPTGINATEKYNGTNWTAANPLNSPISKLGSAGTQTSALGFGGIPTSSPTGQTESYNGTNWTTVNPLNTARYALGS